VSIIEELFPLGAWSTGMDDAERSGGYSTDATFDCFGFFVEILRPFAKSVFFKAGYPLHASDPTEYGIKK